MHANYFEGTLQLRNPTKEVLTFVKKSKDQIVKEKKVRNGLDFDFKSQRYLRALGKKLQESFSGELKLSRKLFTRNRQSGKEVYRVTVLFRCYPFKKGDTITFNDEKFLLLSVTSKIYMQNTKTKEKQWMTYEKLPSNFRVVE